jgi:hypothetical protein
MIPPLTAAAGVIQGASAAATIVSKIGDVILAPFNLIYDWGTEPLKRYEHQRTESSKDRDVERDIERQVGVDKALSEQRMREQKHKNDLAIERETEVVRIITEIEQLKKDKEFERMKSVSDAMMEYQIQLTRINVEAVEVIGIMRIELQKRAYDLIQEKSQQFYEHKKLALADAQSQLETIHASELPDSMKDILSGGVAEILSTTIRDATQFIQQLNDDMAFLNKDINLITSNGQEFIQRHLEHFKTIDLPSEIIQDD